MVFLSREKHVNETFVRDCHGMRVVYQAAPGVSLGVGRSEKKLLDQVEVEEVAIPVGRRMVIGENPWEHELVEENESVVAEGDQDPWGGGRIGQDGIVSSWDNN